MRVPMAAVALLLTGLVVSGCSLCGDEDVRKAVSPDRRYIMRTFVRNCGVTTDYVTRVEITETRCLFACSLTPYTAHGYRTALASWQAADRVLVECPGCGARSELRWGQVVVRFRDPAPASDPE